MSRPASFPQHHAIRTHAAGRGPRAERSVYVLYQYDDTGAAVRVESVCDYVVSLASYRSVRWQRETVRAIGLLLDFAVANADEYALTERPQLLEGWAHALHDGTISADGTDPSGLFWRGRQRVEVEKLLHAVTAFSDWMTQRHGTAPINPWRKATFAERVVAARRADYRNARSILGHLRNRSAPTHVRTVRAPGTSLKGYAPDPLAFDEDRIRLLLREGFRRTGVRANAPEHERLHLPGILMTIAMHGGGLRRSELLHAYVDDVLEDPTNPDNCQLRIYHPEQGRSPASFVDERGQRIVTHRAEYLRLKWNWQPRTRLTNRFAAGFKGLLLSDTAEKYSAVHWFPKFWGEEFKHYFDLYIQHQRSRHCAHPFLLVSQNPRFAGEPFTLGAFQRLHATAMRRIGLLPSWGSGTTPHAHRHAFGQRLAAAGAEPAVIQQAMHHRSLESQECYTRPSARRTADELAAAERRLALVASRPPSARKDERR